MLASGHAVAHHDEHGLRLAIGNQIVRDAGYVTLSGTYLGHTLMRRVDEALSASSGYEVLCDTNNSSEDFYESEIQSLHE